MTLSHLSGAALLRCLFRCLTSVFFFFYFFEFSYSWDLRGMCMCAVWDMWSIFKSLLEIWLANIFFQSVASLCSPNSIFWKAEFWIFYIDQFISFFLLWILLLVLYLRNLWLIQGHISGVFSQKYVVLGLTLLGLWSIIGWFLYVMWALYPPPPYMCMCCCSTPFIEKAPLSPGHCLWASCQGKLPGGFSLGCVSILHLSVLMPLLQRVDGTGFTVLSFLE